MIVSTTISKIHCLWMREKRKNTATSRVAPRHPGNRSYWLRLDGKLKKQQCKLTWSDTPIRQRPTSAHQWSTSTALYVVLDIPSTTSKSRSQHACDETTWTNEHLLVPYLLKNRRCRYTRITISMWSKVTPSWLQLIAFLYRTGQSLVLDMNSMPPHYVSPNRHTLVAVSHSPILQWPKPKRIAPRAVPLLRMRYFLLLFSALAVPGHLGLAPGQIMRIVRSVMKSYSAFPFSCSMHVLTRKDSWPAGPSKPQYKIW